MRPTGVEAIRGIQGALMSVIAPELQSMFAQDTGQTLQMLLESLANEWDTAAETLVGDNRRLVDLLTQARAALSSLPAGHEGLGALAEEIGRELDGPPSESLAVSQLSACRERLYGLLERTIVACEEGADRPELAPLMPVREAIYRHLRVVAARGWSLWDALSFRERMARWRAESA